MSAKKPIFHIVNLDEKAIADGERVVERFGLEEVAGRARTRVGWVSAVIETEIARLEGEEQQAFLGDLGLAEPAIRRVLRECYALLGLVSFFTCGEDEVRAWPIPEGTRARDGSRTANARRVVLKATGQVLGAASSEGQTIVGEPQNRAPASQQR